MRTYSPHPVPRGRSGVPRDAAGQASLPSGTRVLIVEQHEIFRAGLRAILEGLSLVAIVGEVTNAVEAVRVARRSRPDCILLDGELPPDDNAALIRQLRAASPRSAVVVLSGSVDPRRVLDAIGAGAAAYLLKEVPREQLAAAIDRATSGEAFIDPALAGRVVQAMTSPSALSEHPEPLTPREMDVLRAVSRGRSNKEIAFDLQMATGTVKVHVERILRKLTASNRVEATTRALRYGLIGVDDNTAAADQERDPKP